MKRFIISLCLSLALITVPVYADTYDDALYNNARFKTDTPSTTGIYYPGITTEKYTIAVIEQLQQYYGDAQLNTVYTQKPLKQVLTDYHDDDNLMCAVEFNDDTYWIITNTDAGYAYAFRV